MQIKNYGSVPDLANAYWNANKSLNGATDIVTIPGADATPEQIAAYRGKLGVPGEVAGYDEHIKLDGIQNVNEPLLNFGKEMMHKAGVPAGEAQGVIDMWEKFVGDQNTVAETAQAEANNAEIAQIKKDVGDQFDTLVDNGKRAVRALGLSDAELAGIEGAAGTASVMKLMAQLGKGLREGNVSPPGAPQGSGQELSSPAAANTEINRLRGDAGFSDKYNNPAHPQHKEAIDQMAKLYEAANRTAG